MHMSFEWVSRFCLYTDFIGSFILFYQVLCIIVLVTAAVALSKDDSGSTNDQKTKRTLACGLVVGVAVITLVIQVGFTVLRFANVGILNYAIRWFLIVVSLTCLLQCVFITMELSLV